MMIIFAADDHYGARPGAVMSRNLQNTFPHRFVENDWSALEDSVTMDDCTLLILNLIAGTGAAAIPGDAVERQIKAYVEKGRPLLLLHSASAAFWHWGWWRQLVGYRWVRGEDPDGATPSIHPVHPYRVEVSKNRHSLCQQFKSFDVPEDEIYIKLEQTCPTMVLMETTIPEGTYPQCYLSQTSWGGQVAGFLPGHRPEVVGLPQIVDNVSCLIRFLTVG